VDLYLVRHAVAESRDYTRWPDDSLRPLSENGIELFRRVARGLRALGVEVEAVLSSPYARAWRTAELLSEEAGWPSPEMTAELEPTATPESCAGSIGRRSEQSLAVVGHQPNLSEVASLLLAGDAHAADVEFKKGGVLCLRFRGAPEAGAGTLRWSASPKLLRRICERE
jgi:phosphohistidine phosphatase